MLGSVVSRHLSRVRNFRRHPFPHFQCLFNLTFLGWSDGRPGAEGLFKMQCVGFGAEDGSVEYNEALSREQASGAAAALQAGGAEGSIPWDKRSREPGICACPGDPQSHCISKKGLMSLACKKVGSGLLRGGGNSRVWILVV